MIRTASWYTAPGYDPYENLAREEYFLSHLQPGECLLYLWQNQNTVVIGKNQNCWKECHVTKLEQEGGHLARRLSGGGAVYHDLGNLNFTFLCRPEDYNVDRQTSVVLKAVQSLGIAAEKTGRNDLTVNGRKFSGNAYYESRQGCYQHGTLLLAADGEKMSAYLNVSREKLAAKSVASVRARVCNLTEYLPDLTPQQMCQALLQAFGCSYGTPTPLDPGRLDQNAVEKLVQKYKSPAWKYGSRLDFGYEFGRRFSWGEVQLQFAVKGGQVDGCRVYTDSLDTTFAQPLGEALVGKAFCAPSLCAAITAFFGSSGPRAKLAQDLANLIEDQL